MNTRVFLVSNGWRMVSPVGVPRTPCFATRNSGTKLARGQAAKSRRLRFARQGKSAGILRDFSHMAAMQRNEMTIPGHVIT